MLDKERKIKNKLLVQNEAENQSRSDKLNELRKKLSLRKSVKENIKLKKESEENMDVNKYETLKVSQGEGNFEP